MDDPSTTPGYVITRSRAYKLSFIVVLVLVVVFTFLSVAYGGLFSALLSFALFATFLLAVIWYVMTPYPEEPDGP